MKIKHQNRYTEIGRLSKDHDFLMKQLGGDGYLADQRLVNFLTNLEIKINDLVEEGYTDIKTLSTTRVKVIQLKEREIKLNLNIHAHKRAYFLFTIYKLAHQCYEEGGRLEVEN